MANHFELKPVQNRGAQLLVRLLISSYFMAMATGVVPYENGRAFMELAFPTPYDSFAFTGFVFIAAYLVLLGKHVRIAALLLSVFVFWASYIANFSFGKTLDLQGFWSDLALIGALMLTATEGDSRQSRKTTTRIGKAIRPRRVQPTLQKQPQSVSSDTLMADLPVDNDAAPAEANKVIPLLLINNDTPAIEFRRHSPREVGDNDLDILRTMRKSSMA